MKVKAFLEAELNKVQKEYERLDTDIYYARLALNKQLNARYELGNLEEEIVYALQELYGDD